MFFFVFYFFVVPQLEFWREGWGGGRGHFCVYDSLSHCKGRKIPMCSCFNTVCTLCLCLPLIADVDECTLNKNLCLNGVCQNTHGSFVCKCDIGFSVKTGIGATGCTGILNYLQYVLVYVCLCECDNICGCWPLCT